MDFPMNDNANSGWDSLEESSFPTSHTDLHLPNDILQSQQYPDPPAVNAQLYSSEMPRCCLRAD
ncbi:hypothetical protein BDZ97DRAFT_1813413 [Flammula alnicola]|nr:hypothetical protein BDZ97DRAFT_1887894 [Flammula alnicola]KAF8965059.1 hypothetical protein BDZ97DRAFT_1813413 [Flammula alnicola]